LETLDDSNVALNNIKRHAMNFFQSLNYYKDKISKADSDKRASGRLRATAVTNDNSPVHDTFEPNNYELSSMRLRRYLLEDVMFTLPGHKLLLLVSPEHRDYIYWKKIVEEQDNQLPDICISGKHFSQIRATVYLLFLIGA